MTLTLYSLRTADSAYAITKFVDGEPEATYTTSRDACTCPAGARPTCRHRQMLPQMLNAQLANQPYFWDFDNHKVVDFEGKPPATTYFEFDATIPQPHSVTVSTGDFDSLSGGSNPPAVANSHPWRRI